MPGGACHGGIPWSPCRCAARARRRGRGAAGRCRPWRLLLSLTEFLGLIHSVPGAPHRMSRVMARLSEYLLPTEKEAPADGEAISHKLMVRAGLIRQMGAGIWTWLPAGWRGHH